MTFEAQRIAIAGAYGYIDLRSEEVEEVDIECRTVYVNDGVRGTLNGKRGWIPDYLNDLNAMHEVEKTLTAEWECEQYSDALKTITNGFASDPFTGISGYPFHATAAQRAEAFLRTLNLWTTQ